jgi:CUB domain
VNNNICCSSSLPFVKNCGTDQNGTSGTIQSPNYPSAYSNGAACIWNITAPVDTYINFTFTNFQTDSNDRLFILLPQTCTYANSNYLSGSLSPFTVSVAQNTAVLYFYSDASYTLSGFNINWNSYSPATSGANCIKGLGYGFSVRSCGSDLSGTSGTIQSPNYPLSYNTSIVCNWNILAPAGTVITLNFTAFYTENGFDFFHVLLPQDCSNVGKRFAGRLGPQVITVHQNSASLFFRSDSIIAYSGFNLNWYATPTCKTSAKAYLPYATEARITMLNIVVS